MKRFQAVKGFILGVTVCALFSSLVIYSNAASVGDLKHDISYGWNTTVMSYQMSFIRWLS